MNQAVILCGGKGTRLGALTKDVPKPLLPVDGEVLLDRTIRLLKKQGFTNILLLAGHLGEQIQEHYATGEFEGVEVSVFLEPEPLGTAGALPLVKNQLEEQFLIVYGDVFIDFDARRLAQTHEESQKKLEQKGDGSEVIATLLIRQSDHPWDSHLVEVNDDGYVSEFIFQQEEGRLYKNYGNVAIYACNKRIVDFIPRGETSDYGRNIFPKILNEGGILKALELEIGGFVRDMGTPDRLKLVENYLKRKERSFQASVNPKPLRVAFLDRDGTLNVEKGLISSPDQIEMIEGAAEAVADLCRAGWQCFILTNQPGIARGLCDEATVERINERVVAAIESAGGHIEKVYYSPYHPETHHGEGVKELRRASECRKPNSGMLYQAEEEYGLDLAEVIMIGDSWRDVVAGQGAGVRTCFLGDQHEGEQLRADFIADTLRQAIKTITSI